MTSYCAGTCGLTLQDILINLIIISVPCDRRPARHSAACGWLVRAVLCNACVLQTLLHAGLLLLLLVSVMLAMTTFH